MKIIAGFGPVPQPTYLTYEGMNDRLSQQNGVLGEQYQWNSLLPMSIQAANSFIGAYNSGGAVDWTKLTPLVQAIVLGKVTGYVPYDDTITDAQWADYQDKKIGPGDFWRPAYNATGPSLPPPPGVPNGAGFGV